MKIFKKLFVYIFITVLVTLAITNITLKINSGYFNDFSIILTTPEDEIYNIYYQDALDFSKDTQLLEAYQKSFESAYENVPEHIEDKEGYILFNTYFVTEGYRRAINLKTEITYYTQALVAGIIIGTFIYLVTNLTLKLTWLKLILGFAIFFIIVILGGSILIGFKNIIDFHLGKYIFWSIVAYALSLLANLGIQKMKINKLNKKLNK